MCEPSNIKSSNRLGALAVRQATHIAALAELSNELLSGILSRNLMMTEKMDNDNDNDNDKNKETETTRFDQAILVHELALKTELVRLQKDAMRLQQRTIRSQSKYIKLELVKLQADHASQAESLKAQVNKVDSRLDHTKEFITHLQEELVATSSQERIWKELAVELLKGCALDEVTAQLAGGQKLELMNKLVSETLPKREARWSMGH